MKSLIILFLIPLKIFASNFESEGDEFFSKRNILKNGKVDITMIENSIMCYSNALQNYTNDVLLYKYVKAIDFKLHYLVNDSNIREKAYKSLIYILEKNYEKYKNSKYMNFALSLVWGRYGEELGGVKAAKNGIVSKVKFYTEKLYSIDKSFEDYAACLILGRMNYKAPKIPFLLNWPSLEKSEKYLKEALENTDSIAAKFYLAETLYKLEKYTEAKKLFNEVLKTIPKTENYLEDLEIINECQKYKKILENN